MDEKKIKELARRVCDIELCLESLGMHAPQAEMCPGCWQLNLDKYCQCDEQVEKAPLAASKMCTVQEVDGPFNPKNVPGLVTESRGTLGDAVAEHEAECPECHNLLRFSCACTEPLIVGARCTAQDAAEQQTTALLDGQDKINHRITSVFQLIYSIERALSPSSTKQEPVWPLSLVEATKELVAVNKDLQEVLAEDAAKYPKLREGFNRRDKLLGLAGRLGQNITRLQSVVLL